MGDGGPRSQPRSVTLAGNLLSSLYPVVCGPWAHRTVHSRLKPHSSERKD